MADSDATPATQHNRQHRHRRRGGNRGHNAQNQESVSSPSQTILPGGRAFGGHLTTPAQLHAEAPTFVPASVAPNSPSGPRRKKPPTTNRGPPPGTSTIQTIRSRRNSRSNAPDLATRIHEDIAHNLYECAICANEIGRNSKVWSCLTCWTVFHIGCIKKWSKNEGSAVHRGPQVEQNDNIGKQWRCPGCNLPQDVLPSAYTCWCEKEMDPKVIGGLPPHSCGQTCGKERKFPKACPHPCDLLCHAGPCPPCTSIGPMQGCFCGKQTTTRRCLETEYESGWSCGAVCGDTMPCGEHTCERPCHEGLCGACPVEVESRCYCGKIHKSMPCSERNEEKQSYDWIGVFDCHQDCGNVMDCGIHHCEKSCHPQNAEVPHCPRSPDVVTHCHCGKTELASLAVDTRTSCTDPIPSCAKPCGRELPCGHSCTQVCHSGDCPTCLLTMPLSCRCGRNSFKTICSSGDVEHPWCMRICRATLNCGRHECGERCCTGERKAAERQATKRKLKPLGAHIFDNNIEAEHICTRVCGRLLKCGNHTCPDLCHKGPCASCKEAIFDDITCNCGRTSLQAPLPCGTRPPPCFLPCRRAKNCGHPQVAHNCHTDEEECPKCPFLTERVCLCGKKVLKNQPCWRADVICGLVCGKTLKCGSHACRKTCHRPGECEDALAHCQQECCKPKKTCGHPCEQPCHAPSVCKEEKPCPFRVMITCDCQRKKEEVRCNARGTAPDPPGRQTSLKCDDECAKLERNRKLALALHIPDDHTDDHVPYSTATLKMYLDDIAWAHKQEEVMRLFAADGEERRHRFKPMKPQQRAFIHSLADDFRFDGESLDPEPHRHILLFKTPKFVSAPMKTLAQAARIKRAQLATQAPVSTATVPEIRADEVSKAFYNGFLLRNPKFALTEQELRAVLRKAAPTTDFDILFLSSTEAIALLPRDQWDGPEQLLTLLSTLQPSVSNSISSSQLAAATVLCEFDTSANGNEPRIVREAGVASGGETGMSGGWSQVAAKRSAPMQAPTVKAVGQRTLYTVLGSRLAEAKKKRKEEEEMAKKREQLQSGPVVDDWSLEADNDDEKEEEEVAPVETRN